LEAAQCGAIFTPQLFTSQFSEIMRNNMNGSLVKMYEEPTALL